MLMELTRNRAYPARYAAALEVLYDGGGINATAQKHGIDQGQLSRFVRYAKERHVEKLAEARLEEKFWELVADSVDNTSNVPHTRDVE